MIVLDTSIFFELVQPHALRHAEVFDWFARQRQRFVTTPLIIAELDYMLHRHGEESDVQTLYANLDTGSLTVQWWPEAMTTTLAVVRRRPDIGLTDASLVALAAHRVTPEIATLDERHFRTLTPLTGEVAFRLLPADAD